MATIGTREYPEYSLSECLRYADEVKKQKITTFTALLPILGHKNPKSSGVWLKLSSLGKFYGILEKDGQSIKFTAMGEHIVYNIGGKLREGACREAASSVSLFKDLYARLGLDYNPQDFSPVLQEISGAKPAEVELKARAIENVYRDAARYLHGSGHGGEPEPTEQPADQTAPPGGQNTPGRKTATSRDFSELPEGEDSLNYHEYTSGGTHVRIAKDVDTLRNVEWMIRGWIKQEDGSGRRTAGKKASRSGVQPEGTP